MKAYLDVAVAAGIMVRPVVITVLLYGLWAGLRRTEFDRGRRIATWIAVGLPLLAWFAVSDTLGRAGVFQPRVEGLPLLPIAIVVPLGVGLFLTLRSERLGAVLDAIPDSWLIGVQVYRVLGVVFLVQWARDLAPGLFALPAGIGDILTGLLALPVAAYVASRAVGARARAIGWNLFGISDLVLALALGVLTTPGPGQAMAFDNPNRFDYPLVMIPIFAVPLSLILHGLSLRQLARRRTLQVERATARQVAA
jgi:hypothetical protein